MFAPRNMVKYSVIMLLQVSSLKEKIKEITDAGLGKSLVIIKIIMKDLNGKTLSAESVGRAD